MSIDISININTDNKKEYDILTENGALAYDASNEPIIKQIWSMVDDHITNHINIYERYKITNKTHRNFFDQLHKEVKSYMENKNIKWLNSIFILIIRKRDYRNGGEGHKMLYFSLLFNFLDALYKADCIEAVEFYKYVASKISNYYGCWKDLKTMINLLNNIDKIKDNEEEQNEYSIDYSNIINFKEYCLEAYEEQLKIDIENYKQNKPISLCSKFAPTQNTDKKFSKFLARKLFKDSKTPDKDYRQIITQLHTYGNVIEQFICCKKLEQFNPNFITGCSKQYYKKQINHPEKYNWSSLIDKLNQITNKKLKEVEEINNRLNEIIKEIFILQSKGILSDNEKEQLDKLLNEQSELKNKLKSMKITSGSDSSNIIQLLSSIFEYNGWGNISINKNPITELMIEAIKAKLDAITKLDALCVCDTSGSMYGDPLNAALMLTYLISSTASNLKFRNKFITFSNNPYWLDAGKGTIYDFIDTVLSHNICESTNIQKTIDLITSSLKDTPDFNPKVIFFFTDGQFNEMSDNIPVSCKDYIKIKFEEINKEPPLCIFWNLRNCNAIEAKSDDNGFILYSGFSQSQLDNISNGIFSLESEGKTINNLSTEDLIIQFLHSSFKDNIINIYKSYNNIDTFTIKGKSFLSNI